MWSSSDRLSTSPTVRLPTSVGARPTTAIDGFDGRTDHVDPSRPAPGDAQAPPADSVPTDRARPTPAPTDTVPTDSVPTDSVPLGPVVDQAPAPTVAGAELLPSRDGSVVCVGPAQGTGEVFSKGSAALTLDQGFGVSVGLRGDGQATWNALANECYNATPTCPSTQPGLRGQIAIVLDDVVQSAPQVNQPNFTDSVAITGDFSKAEAEDLVSVLNRGAFPVQVEAQEARTVSASAGSDSLHAAIIAGLVGMLLVVVLLLAYYRWLGLVIVGGLIVWAGMVFSMASFVSGWTQLRAQPGRCDRHHRGHRRHRRQLRGVLRADQGRTPQRSNDQERGAAQLQDDVADDLVGRRRLADRRHHPVLAERRVGARLRAVPRAHDDLRPARLLLLHPSGRAAARAEQVDGRSRTTSSA